MRFLASLIAVALAASLGAAVTDDELGRFVAEQAGKGVTGTALADAIVAKAGKADAHAAPGAVAAAAAKPGEPDYAGLGAFVRQQIASGMKGQALADAIHGELAKRHVGDGHGDPGGADHGKDGDNGKDGEHGNAGAAHAAGHGGGHGR